MWNEWISEKYNSLSTFRIKRTKQKYDTRLFVFNQRSYLNFVSNDYLGIASHPALIESLYKTAQIYGIGSTGAPSLSGYSEIHEELTLKIAKWLNYENCLLFNSGYQLNSSIFNSLADADTMIWFDKNCHASHIDGIRLSKAKFHTFNALSISAVIEKIEQLPNTRHIILTEGSFSMDGTCSYLESLIICRKNHPKNVILIIDDAHGIGTLGTNGFGTIEQLGLSFDYIDLLIGTFGKAFATQGGYICGKNIWINYLSQTARGSLFSTNTPPCIAASSIASLNLISSALGSTLRTNLQNNITYFIKSCSKYALPLYNRESNISPIQLLVFDNEETVTRIFNQLYVKELLVGKICYPTVKKNAPRIRISITAAHTFADIEALCAALSIAIKD
jgi:7-keto-8-aminopelargonate synthetase-like enzyme